MLPYQDLLSNSIKEILFQKMLVLNFLFFLPDSMILSIFMLAIQIRAILNSELKGLHENVQNFYSRCLGSQEIDKNEVETVLVDTLYLILYGKV